MTKKDFLMQVKDNNSSASSFPVTAFGLQEMLEEPTLLTSSQLITVHAKDMLILDNLTVSLSHTVSQSKSVTPLY